MAEILQGDSREVLTRFPDNHFHAVVCDPPYELTDGHSKKGFMGKAWDGSGVAFDVNLWAEVLRVLRPGGYLLAFGGSRTFHRMACAIEDAGFEIRDSIIWVYGSGFPKSSNVSKSLIDRGLCCVCGSEPETKHEMSKLRDSDLSQTLSTEYPKISMLQPGLLQCSLPTSKNPKRNDATRGGVEGRKESCVEGRGDILQDSRELQRHSLCQMPAGVPEDCQKGRLYNGASVSDGSISGSQSEENGSDSSYQPRPNRQPDRKSGDVAEQQITQSRGAWPNCPRCSKPIISGGLGTALKPAHEPITMARKPLEGRVIDNVRAWGCGAVNVDGCRIGTDDISTHGGGDKYANLKIGQSDGVGSYQTHSGRFPSNFILGHAPGCAHGACAEGCPVRLLDEQSGISKTPAKVTRGASRTGNCGLSELGRQNDVPCFGDEGTASRFFLQVEPDPFFYCAKASPTERANCKHPTIKPLKLISYLVKLVTPPGGLVLDPFLGSGTTGLACDGLGFDWVGIDLDTSFARERLAAYQSSIEPNPHKPLTAF